MIVIESRVMGECLAEVAKFEAKVKIKPVGRPPTGECGPGRRPAASAARKMISRHPAVIELLLLPLLLLQPLGPARETQAAATGAVGFQTISSSELSFEFLGLKSVPSDQLCALMEAHDGASARTANQVNLV